MMNNTSNKMQVDRLSSLLDQTGKISLVALSELQLVQKQQSRLLEKRIRTYKDMLVRSIYERLMLPIEDLGMTAILKAHIANSEENPRWLLIYLLESTFNSGINQADEFFVLIGSSSSSVKKEDLIPFELCKQKCADITKLWDGLAEIDCYDENMNDGLINFGFNASKLIHSKVEV